MVNNPVPGYQWNFLAGIQLEFLVEKTTNDARIFQVVLAIDHCNGEPQTLLTHPTWNNTKPTDM